MSLDMLDDDECDCEGDEEYKEDVQKGKKS